jgi:hypothetical protein
VQKALERLQKVCGQGASIRPKNFGASNRSPFESSFTECIKNDGTDGKAKNAQDSHRLFIK